MMGGNAGMMGGGTHGMPSGMGGSQMMGGVPKGGIEWDDSDNAGMNAMSNTDMVTWKIVDQDSGNANMDIAWKFKVGER
jgi:hypothetical protein